MKILKYIENAVQQKTRSTSNHVGELLSFW